MARIVLTDASPLIGLSIVQGLDWLHALFGTVWMPVEVEREVLAGPVSRGQDAIRAMMASGTLRRWDRALPEVTLPDLDEGEAACIRAAMAHQATSGNKALILMDERAGRAVAMERGVHVAGTAAVIGMAQARGLIPSARDVFEALLQSDFRISAEVIRTVLVGLERR